MRVGQKVVCINDSAGWLDGEKKLVKDEIYTILNVFGKDIQVMPNDAGWDKSRFRLIDYDFAENILLNIKEEVLVS